jgi:hypothetical protein
MAPAPSPRAGTAQLLFGGVVPDAGYAIYNADPDNDLWINDTGAAAAPNAAGAIRLAAGAVATRRPEAWAPPRLCRSTAPSPAWPSQPAAGPATPRPSRPSTAQHDRRGRHSTTAFQRRNPGHGLRHLQPRSRQRPVDQRRRRQRRDRRRGLHPHPGQRRRLRNPADMVPWASVSIVGAVTGRNLRPGGGEMPVYFPGMGCRRG